MSSSTETFQISAEAAERYEAAFVPALFARWADTVLLATAPRPGQAVLDVACGTGVVARKAADQLAGTGGRVVGVDLNPAMLAVARRLRPELEWRQADAAQLPFPDASFDLVTCQAALMFFPDPVRVLRELSRVTRPDGRVTVQVPGRFEASPAYVALAEVARRYDEAAPALLRGYFRYGDVELLTRTMTEAGLSVVATQSEMGVVAFPTLRDFVSTEIQATPLAGRLTPAAYAQLLVDAETSLASHVDETGRSKVPIESHVLVARPSLG